MVGAPYIVPLYRRLLELNLQGTVFLLGGPDSGKTTLAHFLWRHLSTHYHRMALLDTDPGQSTTGPPTTLTLTFRDRQASGVRLSRMRYFVGNTSPRGYMLPMLAGTMRLHQEACRQGASLILLDTCGLVSREGGGVVLKNHKIECIRPDWLIALQREEELEPILQAWESVSSMRIVRARVPDEVRIKTPPVRRARRNFRLQRYFAHAPVVRLSLHRYRRFIYHSLQTGRLVGLLDDRDFLLGLGILLAWHPSTQTIEIRTPLQDTVRVSAIRTGRLLLNPLTGEEILPFPALRQEGGVQERPHASQESNHEKAD